MRLVCATTLFVCLVSAPVFAQNGTLKMRIVYGGDQAPIAPDIIPQNDQEFCGKHKIPDENLLVNKENLGIQNALVFVYTSGRGATKLKNVPPGKAETKVLDNKGCRFAPHVMMLQIGDTLRVTNSDLVGHNVNLKFIENTPINLLIPPGGKHDTKIEKGEPGLIEVECNIHQWMQVRLLVLDHPYAAISDKDGNIVINDLPTEKLVFRFMLESIKKYDGINVGGKPNVNWKRNNFELTIKPGDNDLGEVVVPTANF